MRAGENFAPSSCECMRAVERYIMRAVWAGSRAGRRTSWRVLWDDYGCMRLSTPGCVCV